MYFRNAGIVGELFGLNHHPRIFAIDFGLSNNYSFIFAQEVLYSTIFGDKVSWSDKKYGI